jgi:adenosine deaminase
VAGFCFGKILKSVRFKWNPEVNYITSIFFGEKMTDFESLPKVELHLHLEGAIPLPALWKLIEKYGGDLGTPDERSLAKHFEYADFPHFLQIWSWKNQFLREYEDFTWIAQAVAQDLAKQSVRYAECFFSPTEFAMFNLTPQKIVEAIRAGLDQEPAIEILLIADLVRNSSQSQAARTLAEVNEVRNLGVVGIGIGGPEKDYPPQAFESVYAEARRLGMHTTAHAGEAAGAESIWGALRSLQVQRIGHGTRAYEDPALLDYLRDNNILMEMCPISNLRTKVVPSVEALPIRRFFDHGLRITINTDDPKMFGNCLVDEYRLLEEKFGFSPEEIRSLILNGIKGAWAEDDVKQRIIKEINDFKM